MDGLSQFLDRFEVVFAATIFDQYVRPIVFGILTRAIGGSAIHADIAVLINGRVGFDAFGRRPRLSGIGDIIQLKFGSAAVTELFVKIKVFRSVPN